MNSRAGRRPRWLMGALCALAGPLCAAPVQQWRLAGEGGRVEAVSVSFEGVWAAARLREPGQAGDALVVVDLSRGRPAARVSAGPRPLSNPCWLPGSRLVAADGQWLYVWAEAGSGAVLRWPARLADGPLVAAANGFRVAAPAADGGVLVLDVRTGETVARLTTRRPVAQLALDEAGEVAVTATAPTTAEPWSTLTRWRVDGALRQAVRVVAPCTALLGGGRALGWLTAHQEAVTIWSTDDLEPRQRWLQAAADRLALAPERTLLAGGRSGERSFWFRELPGGETAGVALAGPLSGLACAGGGRVAVTVADRLEIYATGR